MVVAHRTAAALPGLSVAGNVGAFRFIPPTHSPASLAPMEDFLFSLGDYRRRFSLELFGKSGVVSYMVRSDDASGMQAMLSPCYPQGRYPMLGGHGDDHDAAAEDWLYLQGDERVMVQPLWLDKPSYLPLRTYSDDDLQRAEMDPLAAVVGTLAKTGQGAGNLGIDRLGLRLLLQPAKPDWSNAFQRILQVRRDGDDHIRPDQAPGRTPIRDETPGPNIPLPALIALVALGGLGYYCWKWWVAEDYLYVALSGLGTAVATAGGLYFIRRFGLRKGRVYYDDRAVEEKLGSPGFMLEAQLMGVFHDTYDGTVRSALDHLAQAMCKFNYASGNSWKVGKPKVYEPDTKALLYNQSPLPEQVSGLGVASSRRFKHSIVSAREVAGLWHPPLLEDEMASMERAGVRSRIPYLEGLDEGAPVGVTVGSQELRVCLPDSAIAKHALFIGKSGSGKSTMIKHVVNQRLQEKARGISNGAIVVIDPHADLVRDILQVVPPEIADKVRLLDLGREDRIPAINMMDPEIFPDRDRCVDTIIETLRHLWEGWGPRLQDILDRSLKAIYEFNCHPDTERDDMLTMLDILRLLEDGKVTRQGRTETVEQSAFQKHVLSRVADPDVVRWFGQFMNWPRDTRAESLGPVQSRMGSYASNNRSKVLLGQKNSTIVLHDVLREEQVLLVATASGTIGKGPAALMGGTIVSLIESALRNQEKLPPSERKKCLLIADEFQTITGTSWEDLLAEIRKYGCSIMLATQSAARLDTPERKLKDGVLGNCGCLIAYQVSSADAHIISGEMGREWVTEEDLTGIDPHCAYVKINLSTKSIPAFSLRTLPPPEMGQDPTDAIAAVEAAMVSYTCDRAEALAKINADLRGGMAEEVHQSQMGVEGIKDVPAAAGKESLPAAESAAAGPVAASPERSRAGGKPSGPAGAGLYAAQEKAFAERRRSGEVPPPVGSASVLGGGITADKDDVKARHAEIVASYRAQREAAAAGSKTETSGAARPDDSRPDAQYRRYLIQEGMTDEMLDKSSFTPSFLNAMYKQLDKDPAMRFLVDQRLRGRVRNELKRVESNVTQSLKTEHAADLDQAVAAAKQAGYEAAQKEAAAVLEAERKRIRAEVEAMLKQEQETARELSTMNETVANQEDTEVEVGVSLLGRRRR